VTRDEQPVRVGLILTTVEDREGTTTPRWSDIAARAKAAEAAGFYSLWISDHLIHRVPGVADYGIWECWSIVAALAAVTERAQIGHWVLGSGFRNPALTAKMTETVDEISNGRVILGIGAGWHEPEYLAFGYPFDNRTGRFAEAIAIIHGLLREGRVDLEGAFNQARDCELRPRGPRPQGAPIMVGTIGGTPLARHFGIPGNSPKMLELAARYADIWNCPWINDPAEAPAIQAMVDVACRAAGRDPETLERSHGLALDLPGWRAQPGNEVTRSGRRALGSVDGTPREHADLIRRFGDAGTDEVHVHLDPETPESIAEFARVIDLVNAG
jgi:alkanesulfonate monooxygenase SsuD/methylene tetrahydromethanopterin reductase-like flavin-dependent oxidoreductase (luciferase family)